MNLNICFQFVLQIQGQPGGLQLLNLQQQRAPLKPGTATLATQSAGQIHIGGKNVTSIPSSGKLCFSHVWFVCNACFNIFREKKIEITTSGSFAPAMHHNNKSHFQEIYAKSKKTFEFLYL